ncbi:GMC oxidoreductase [Nocardia arizonensis]|uniref:GMC oxidoreductase n=1 Tax=Nocardia arizonensis TaxID=1141647 RepID=UPI0006D03F2E|nr:GMC oxidoreductase [Nocardia arizonensis]
MDRRAFLKSGTLAATAALVPGGLAVGRSAVANAEESPRTGLYRSLVPEIFAPLPDPPDHTPAIVIGSGFGGAISALRLAEAGVEVTVLERGSRWPRDPWRDIFCSEGAPDGRGVWHRDSFSDIFTSVAGVPVPLGVDDFGGVLCIDNFPNMRILRAAAVGGGSIVYTGITVQPEQRFFDSLFGGIVDYAEMNDVYYPRVRQMLRISNMPEDIYNSPAFAHTRAWDIKVSRAGYKPLPVGSIFDWGIVRDELQGRSRPSATIGYSTMGNSNGAKFDVTQNYLRDAEDTGNAHIYPGHRVDAIAAEPDGRFSVTITKLAPTGEVLRTRTLTCDRLFLAAGSIGTSQLLVHARDTGRLPNLNEFVGEGWGSNGDAVMAPWLLDSPNIGTNGAPLASRILDESGIPTTLENFSIPGVTFDTGQLVVVGLVLDPTRGRFVYQPNSDSVILDWPRNGGDVAMAAAAAVSAKVAAAGGISILPPQFGYGQACSHPLGGAVIGQVSDAYSRVHGYRGLYVMDGAAVPGNAGAANPSFTISALAERNIEEIIRSGG